jgi:hypothetical protein
MQLQASFVQLRIAASGTVASLVAEGEEVYPQITGWTWMEEPAEERVLS